MFSVVFVHGGGGGPSVWDCDLTSTSLYRALALKLSPVLGPDLRPVQAC